MKSVLCAMLATMLLSSTALADVVVFTNESSTAGAYNGGEGFSGGSGEPSAGASSTDLVRALYMLYLTLARGSMWPEGRRTVCIYSNAGRILGCVGKSYFYDSRGKLKPLVDASRHGRGRLR